MAYIWHIWIERNNTLRMEKYKDEETGLKNIVADVRLRVTTCREIKDTEINQRL